MNALRAPAPCHVLVRAAQEQGINLSAQGNELFLIGIAPYCKNITKGELRLPSGVMQISKKTAQAIHSCTECGTPISTPAQIIEITKEEQERSKPAPLSGLF